MSTIFNFEFMILELSSRKKVTRKPAITEHKSGKHLRAKPSIFEHDKAELSFNNNKNLCIFETKMWKAHIFLIFSSKKVKIFSCFGLKIHKSQTLLWFEPGSQSISAFLLHLGVHTHPWCYVLHLQQFIIQLKSMSRHFTHFCGK